MGKSSNEEPDYTDELAAWQQSENETRYNQAAEYNQAVDSYNSWLNSYNQKYSGLSRALGGLSIVDDEKFGNIGNAITDLNTRLSGLTLDVAKPTWQSTVQTPYGVVQVDTPSLKSQNTNAYNQLISGLSSAQMKLDELKSSRSSEETRIKDFRTGLLGQLGAVQSGLNSADIGNKSLLDSLSQQLDSINTSRSTFASDILHEVYPSGFTDVTSGYDLARSTLNDLFAKRTAEDNRIKGYQSNLRGKQDSFSSLLGNLTIANETGLNDLKRQIDAAQLDAGRFTSPLSFDFNNDLMGIQSIEDQLDRLIADRTTELGRVKSAEDMARQAASTVEQQLGGLNIYNRSSLDALQRAIDDGQFDLESFTSPLAFNFGDVGGRLQSAEDQLAQLFARRNERLGGYRSQLESLTGQLSGIDLWDEAGINKAIEDIEGLRGNVGRFTGSDVTDLGFSIEDALMGGERKLNELFGFRDDIETRAAAERDAALAASFYDMDDFDPFRSKYDALLAEMEKYGATQANDELAAFKSRLDNERSRLAADLTASQTPSGIANSDVYRMLTQMNGGQPMTAEQYMAFLAQLEEEETNPANAGSFSRNLGGVIRL